MAGCWRREMESSCSRSAKVVAFLLLFGPVLAVAQYPEIRRLDAQDVLFGQIQSDIAAFLRASAVGAEADSIPTLSLFRYRLKKQDDLLSLAARLNLPYETLATLNGLSYVGELEERPALLIPNLPGIFVPVSPRSDLESLMASWRGTDEAHRIVVHTPGGDRAYLFHVGQRFHPLERAYFLQVLFRLPLDRGVVTSGYGVRKDPFGGHAAFHNGIDIAAAAGTDVFAAREGVVTEAGSDPVYGKYVVIDHAGGYQTVYGHLERVLVDLNQEVGSGRIIGKVGSTGRSTGPHLHFEIRKEGSSRDPAPLLPF